ncbi:pyocin knob domain-containing protein [Cloacibacillus sp.]|uniref:pyocin knob domain-containing protein n=1 Tax=Cloacibacillus sp. TaxID=2049023 RepID=UPI0025C632A3|nr:pyocin knob domain-containing protein [Cloacibacillus sp.]MCC8056446.1 pyocin knob domain-containing protein [Cloacibacillus sp.]
MPEILEAKDGGVIEKSLVMRLVILDYYDTEAEMRAAHPTGADGDCYKVGDDLCLWGPAAQGWINIGPLRGEAGGSSYLHIRYSAVANPTDTQISTTPNDYMGTCVISSPTAPTTAASYAWYKIKGDAPVLNEASVSQAGIVTTGPQSFAGEKSFPGGIVGNLTGVAYSAYRPEYQAIPENADLNTYKTAGHYTCGGNAVANTVTNTPSSGSFNMEVIYTVVPTGSYIKQTVNMYYTGIVFYRVFDADATQWSTWKQMATMDDIPAVADTSIVKEKIQNLGTVGSIEVNPDNGQVIVATLSTTGNVPADVSFEIPLDPVEPEGPDDPDAPVPPVRAVSEPLARTVTLILKLTSTTPGVEWWGDILWANGEAPVLKPSTTNIITLITLNMGTWYGVSATEFA